jgi:hypothetical protein
VPPGLRASLPRGGCPAACHPSEPS